MPALVLPSTSAACWLISEKHLSGCVTRRSLGEVKIAGQLLQADTRGEDAGSGSARFVFDQLTSMQPGASDACPDKRIASSNHGIDIMRSPATREPCEFEK